MRFQSIAICASDEGRSWRAVLALVNRSVVTASLRIVQKLPGALAEESLNADDRRASRVEKAEFYRVALRRGGSGLHATKQLHAHFSIWKTQTNCLYESLGPDNPSLVAGDSCCAHAGRVERFSLGFQADNQAD
jgi:hypothetical protein